VSLMGIDIGTTGCKAAAYSAEGCCLAAAYREYPTVHPKPGWAELDSRRVLRCTCDAIAEVASKTHADPVSALCISSIGEAVTPVSRGREILGNSILHIDVRGEEEISELSARIDPARFYEINPNILGANYTLPKLLWLCKNQPALYERADKFLLWGDLLAFVMGGEPAVGYSLANRTLLFDIRREDWSPELLQLAGIEKSKLSPCVPAGTEVGVVSDGFAGKAGLPRGVRIIAGGHDQCCNSLGAGVHQPGKAVCGIGTVECITPAYDRIPDLEPMRRRSLNVEHHLLPGLYVSFIYNQSGSLLRWYRDTFAAEMKTDGGGSEVYDRLAAEMPAEPTRLVMLPYLEPTGAPHFINASGVIAGLKAGTTRGEILKSLMEGATFYFIESIDGLRSLGVDTSSLIATGGGAKSDAWLQIKADIFGVPIVRPKITECSALGAAMCAGIATGTFSGAAQAVESCVHYTRTFEPDAGRHLLYTESYQNYRSINAALLDLLRKL